MDGNLIDPCYYIKEIYQPILTGSMEIYIYNILFNNYYSFIYFTE